MKWSGMKTKFSVYVIFSIFLVFFLPCLATAVTSTTGDVDPEYTGVSNPWYVDANMVNPGFDANYADLIIGNTGVGSLLISDSNTVYDSNAYIGFAAGSSGTVDINDGHWYNQRTWDAEESRYWGGSLYVGYEGDGALNLINDGYLRTQSSSYIGFAPGSTGMVDVNDSSWYNYYGDLFVGHGGDGSMVISNGGYVYSYGDTYIGYEPNSTGSVTVTGGQQGEGWDASELDVNGELIVGYEGQGTLLVEEGGYVEADDGLYIGGYPDASGTVTVTGGRIYDVNTTTGLFSGSSQGASEIYVDDELVVGYEGSASLLIEDGANMYVYYDAIIGRETGSTGMATVTGAGYYHEDANVASTDRREIDGSELYVDEDIIVGYDGDGELMISDGGRVESGYDTHIGYESGSRGMVTVTGGAFWQEPSDPNDERNWWVDGSELWVGDDLYVGYDGEGELLIEDGGYVHVGDYTYIGQEALSQGRVTVTGEGSELINDDYLYVGDYGEGELLILDGGYVYTYYSAYIGDEYFSRGRVVVDGPNSVWEVGDHLYVGNDGTGQLSVTNGALVDVDDSLYVGNYGEGEMLISGGSQVYSDHGYIGDEWDWDWSSHGTVTVTGPNSVWDMSDHLYVGNGDLLISDGGLVVSEEAFIHGAYSHGIVTVTGPNSVWDNEHQIYIGPDPEGEGSSYGYGELNISDGGVVEAGSVGIGPGGVLSGDGTLRLTANSVLNYGTIRPGNSIGTLTIDGDLRIREDSILEVEIDNSGNSDLLSVTGDVNIVGGMVQPVPTETILATHQYTIIEANSVEGAFDSIDTAFLDVNMWSSDTSLDYLPENDANSVILNVTAKRFDDPSIVQGKGQAALGGALQRIAEDGGNDITHALQGLDEAEAREAYQQLSGQIRPQLMPVASVDTSKFMGVVSDRMNYAGKGISYYGSGSSSMLAMSDSDPISDNSSTYSTRPNFAIGNNEMSLGDKNLAVWGKGYGVFGDRDSGGGVAGYDYTVYGSSFGVDYKVNDSALVGITAGSSKSVVDSSLAGNNSDISSKHIGIYYSKDMDDWQIDSILAGSILEYDTERYVSFVDERLNGDSDGKAISGYIEARYDSGTMDTWQMQPLAAFQFSLLDIDSYTEDGGLGTSDAALSYGDQDYNSYKGSLGIKMTKDIFNQEDQRSANVQLRGRWVHEFGDDNSSVKASFLTDPGVVFKVSDDDISRDSIVLGGSINAGLSKSAQISIGYDAQLNSDDTMHILSAMFMYRW